MVLFRPVSVSLPDSEGINLKRKNQEALGRAIISTTFRCDVSRELGSHSVSHTAPLLIPSLKAFP